MLSLTGRGLVPLTNAVQREARCGCWWAVKGGQVLAYTDCARHCGVVASRPVVVA